VLQLARRIAAVAKSKKALKTVILDMRKLTYFCDYFVITGANSHRQVNAIAGAIQEDLSKQGIKSLSEVPSADESGWIVLDYGSVVAHVFYKPMREFYSLERLWSDARKVALSRKTR